MGPPPPPWVTRGGDVGGCLPRRRGRSARVRNHARWQDKESCGARGPRLRRDFPRGNSRFYLTVNSWSPQHTNDSSAPWRPVRCASLVSTQYPCSLSSSGRLTPRKCLGYRSFPYVFITSRSSSPPDQRPCRQG